MTRRIESWHECWGFPRPTLIAMEAGSCVVLQADKDLDLDALIKLEAEGIGERRGEGYGQVRFNPPLLTQAINGWEAAAKADETKPPTDGATNDLSDEEKTFAMLIEETAWREEMKVAVLKIADGLNNRKAIFGFDSEKDKPPMSQIGGLRSAISRLRREMT
jgi:CRISPR-associated protein Csx10